MARYQENSVWQRPGILLCRYSSVALHALLSSIRLTVGTSQFHNRVVLRTVVVPVRSSILTLCRVSDSVGASPFRLDRSGHDHRLRIALAHKLVLRGWYRYIAFSTGTWFFVLCTCHCRTLSRRLVYEYRLVIYAVLLFAVFVPLFVETYSIPCANYRKSLPTPPTAPCTTHELADGRCRGRHGSCS